MKHDLMLIEFIRTSKTTNIQLVSDGGYDEDAIKLVINVLESGLKRGAYIDRVVEGQKQ